MKSGYSTDGWRSRVLSRAQQKQQTRLRLLEVARDLFNRQGFAQTTTREVAHASGVSIGTVFAHFPNKQILLQAVLYEGIEQALASAAETIAPEVDAISAMDAYARALFGFYLSQRALSRDLLQNSLFAQSAFATQLRDFGRELDERWRADGVDKQRSSKLAEAMLSHYFFILLQALNDSRSTVSECVERLHTLNELLVDNAALPLR
jgi:AcrR family transcriptional regulator